MIAHTIPRTQGWRRGICFAIVILVSASFADQVPQPRALDGVGGTEIFAAEIIKTAHNLRRWLRDEGGSYDVFVASDRDSLVLARLDVCRLWSDIVIACGDERIVDQRVFFLVMIAAFDRRLLMPVAIPGRQRIIRARELVRAEFLDIQPGVNPFPFAE